MSVLSNFFGNIFKDIEKSVNKFKESFKTKNVLDIFNSLSDVVIQVARGVEKTAEGIKTTGSIITGPEKKSLAIKELDKLAIKPIREEEEKEDNQIGKMLLGLLINGLEIAIPKLIDIGVEKLNKEKGWQL